jgi:hypothetical protein
MKVPVGGMLSVEGGNAPIPPALPRQPHTNKQDEGKKKGKGRNKGDWAWLAGSVQQILLGLEVARELLCAPKALDVAKQDWEGCEQMQGKQQTFRSWMSGIDLEVYERCVDVA